MPEENLELARRMIAAFESRDVDRLVSLTHPDVQINALVSAFEGAYEGHDGARRWITDLFRLAPDYWLVVADLRPVGEDGFVLLGRQGGTAVAGGVPFEGVMAILGRVRDGLLHHAQAYPTEHEALTAAGLSG